MSALQAEAAPLATWDNSYVALPTRFFAPLAPTQVASPRLIRLNRPLAEALNLDITALADAEAAAIFAGNIIPAGANPAATAYAGHQFGHFVPQLGDGRAILLGEVIGRDGERYDIQLKGAGRTPFSRGGDGRAALGPVLREYIVSEAMAALGIPTTRALAAVTTGESILRDTGPMPGAILTRVAHSHIRVGTFEYFRARGDTEAVRLLADHVIARHYPKAAGAAQPYHALLEAVTGATAGLIAQWQNVGFIHGVMNTDNTSVAGETIDYGPCAFMDSYHPGRVYSSIDHAGRYAYGNQPRIALWNLTRFAETLLPLLADGDEAAIEIAQSKLQEYAGQFEGAYLAGLRRKLGLMRAEEDDFALAQDLLTRMAENQADFTNIFRALGSEAAREQFIDPTAFDGWAEQWHQRLAREGGPSPARDAAMRAANPAFIPRNHRVQAVITAALAGDYAPFDTLLSVLAAPYDDQPEHAEFAKPPTEEEVVRATFCGT
jgi:serine/tyrosine/threonine adenylyltransferase